MKTRFGWIFIALLTCSYAFAQTHITVDNPNTWSSEELRPYLNQEVIFDVPMIVCGNAGGNYTVSPWRKFQPESHGYVGTADYRSTVRINNSCMFSIDKIPAPTTEMGEPSHRCGEKIYNLKALVDSVSPSKLTWLGGTWSDHTRVDLENGLPDLGDYRLLVCGFNLENYFMSVGEMGARSEEERTRQRAKVSKALKQINADIFGLVELQQGDAAIAEIVSDLNNNLPSRNYKYFHDGAEGTFQKVDFVYDANKVAPISEKPAETNVEVQNRKKMMLFRELATGEKFIYSINHFKAMNTGDEARRVNEAKAVVDLYNQYSHNPKIRDRDVLIMGDLNCYAFTAPIKQFLNKGMIDLHRSFHADSSYSYMFGGLASYIDHALCNETMFRQITGMAGYHINSDEDDNYNYQRSGDLTMFRCSDHDPVLVGLKLDSTLLFDPEPSINTMEILDNQIHTLTIRDAYDEESPSIYAIYTMSGVLVEQQPITSMFHDVQLPDAPGMYVIYIYADKQVYQHKFIVP